MAIVQVILVVLMCNRGVAASRTMSVRVIIMNEVFVHNAPFLVVGKRENTKTAYPMK